MYYNDRPMFKVRLTADSVGFANVNVAINIGGTNHNVITDGNVMHQVIKNVLSKFSVTVTSFTS